MKIRNIERDIANPPLYAFLGWYSSYDVHVVWPFPLERVPYFLMIVLHSNSPYYSYMPSVLLLCNIFFTKCVHVAHVDCAGLVANVSRVAHITLSNWEICLVLRMCCASLA